MKYGARTIIICRGTSCSRSLHPSNLDNLPFIFNTRPYLSVLNPFGLVSRTAQSGRKQAVSCFLLHCRSINRLSRTLPAPHLTETDTALRSSQQHYGVQLLHRSRPSPSRPSLAYYTSAARRRRLAVLAAGDNNHYGSDKFSRTRFETESQLFEQPGQH